MKPSISNSIKTVSIVAISGALVLEGWSLYLHLQDKSLPDPLHPIFWLASVALAVHSVEGAIAAFKTKSGNRNPLIYGIYTFFVGTIGLKELSDS